MVNYKFIQYIRLKHLVTKKKIMKSNGKFSNKVSFVVKSFASQILNSVMQHPVRAKMLLQKLLPAKPLQQILLLT